MSDIAIARSPSDAGALFRPRTTILLVSIGVIAFIAMVVTGAYAPGTTPVGGQSGHALSDGATGYSGIIRLARAMGREVKIIRDDRELASDGLMVLTPQTADTPMTDVIGRRAERPTLVVLPKWATLPDENHPGWVNRVGLVPASEPQGVLAPGTKLIVARSKGPAGPVLASAGFLSGTFRMIAPRSLQTISGPHLSPLLTDATGAVILGQIGDGPFYVLADPDVLANMGLRGANHAQSALALLDALNGNHSTMAFDVTLVGLGRPPNPLRLALEPPFLAMTLSLFAAMLLAGWQAFARFGPAARRERAIAFGKAALVDNSAALIRKARRQTRLGGPYVEVIRERAIASFGVPSRLRDGQIDAYLDKLSGRERFTDLARAVETASDRNSLVIAAQALHDWQKEKRT